ncbi:MAG TPA: ABC transporter ATP-binding protein [Acetobacteraceae bacterium]|nr:ABC transporter ATP-binding protein [Acetobacteraceae bacterium]
MTAPLVELAAAGKRFGAVTALQPISLSIEQDNAPILAVAGESGSGKTTLASLLLGFVAPSEGEIRFRGDNIAKLPAARRRVYRREVQAVFQDPFAAYNPFYRVDRALAEPLRLLGIVRSRHQAREMMEAACERVGLHPQDTLGRFPHQLSGGQRQRLMVARALLLRPKLLIADEPVSMIDASLRAVVLGSLRSLNVELGISILYITHDLTTAYHVANAIIVLYRGTVVEAGDAEAVIQNPQHPYTRLLVDSIPSPDLNTPWGNGRPLADSYATPAPVSAVGCPFVARCPHVQPRCAASLPPLYAPNPRQAVRCVLHDDAPRFAEAGLSELLHLNAAPSREIPP